MPSPIEQDGAATVALIEALWHARRQDESIDPILAFNQDPESPRDFWRIVKRDAGGYYLAWGGEVVAFVNDKISEIIPLCNASGPTHTIAERFNAAARVELASLGVSIP